MPDLNQRLTQGTIGTRPLPLYLSLLATLLALGRVIYLHNLSLQDWIQYVPDDAFYYWNFSVSANDTGTWSLNGKDASTGFHLLFAYLLRAVNLFTEDVRVAFLIIGLLASWSIGVATFLMATLATRIWGPSAAVASSLPFFTSAALSQATYMMESWLIILFSAILIFAIAARNQRLTLVFALFAGLLGTTSRTDFIVFPIALVACALLPSNLFTRPPIRASLMGFGGSFLGLLLVSLHTYALSGQLQQASALTKAHWANTQGRTLLPGIEIITSTLIPPINQLLVSITVTGLLGISVVAWISIWKHAQLVSFLHAFGLISLVGFVAVYYFNSAGLQPWYQGNFLVPISLILAGSFAVFTHKAASVVGVVAMLTLLFVGVVRGSYLNPTWTFQKGMLNAAKADEVQGLDSDVIIGSWNAGINATFSNREVINLDGLANNEASKAVLKGELNSYIKDRGITHILDFEEMLINPIYGLRGGYTNENLTQCLQLVARVDGEIESWSGSPLKLYKLLPDCL